MTAERVLILYEGTEPGPREVNDLVRVVERETGVDLLGVLVTALPAAQASEVAAQFLVTRLTKDGVLGPGAITRTTTYAAEAVAGRRIVAVIWALERNPWVRTAIPAHLAKSAGPRLVTRAGWARLASEPALSFVASAGDGTGRRFPEIHVVVSLLHETSPRRIRRLMPGGYRNWLDGVVAMAGVRPGTVDVAHWLVCASGRRRGLYLAYLPTEQHEPALLPWDLLSGAEKHGGVQLA